jgi:hypothetical protein
MKTPMTALGWAMVGLGLIMPGAIANDSTLSPRAMADLDLPPLGTEVQATPVEAAPPLSEVLPETGFTDVAPTHWAFGAVNTLTRRDGCLAGYPDGTFRGDQFVTRYEFAAAMAMCLGNLQPLTEPAPPGTLGDILQDLEALEQELGTLSDDVDALEPKETAQ